MIGVALPHRYHDVQGHCWGQRTPTLFAAQLATARDRWQQMRGEDDARLSWAASARRCLRRRPARQQVDTPAAGGAQSGCVLPASVCDGR